MMIIIMLLILLNYIIICNCLNLNQPSDKGGVSLRINKAIDLSNEKVVNNIEINQGEKLVLCRCWKSEKFPYCNGAHVKHNKETNDNVGPCIISTKTLITDVKD